MNKKKQTGKGSKRMPIEIIIEENKMKKSIGKGKKRMP